MYEDEAAVIRRMMESGVRIIFSFHAEMERMPERNISKDDIKVVLANCCVTEIRESNLGPVWAAQGVDLDDRSLRIPVAVKQNRNAIIIVSAIEL